MSYTRTKPAELGRLMGCTSKRAREIIDAREKHVPAYRCPETGFYLADVAKLERWAKKYARFVNPPRPVRAARAEAASDDAA